MTKIGRIFRRIALCGAFGSMALTAPVRHVPVRPIENRIVAAVSDTVKPLNILVIDGFKKNHVRIDIDATPDIPHGVLVSKIIETGLPNANVYKKSVTVGEDIKKSTDSIVGELFKEIREGKTYDAVNCSTGNEITFPDLSAAMGTVINAENIAKNAKMVKDFLRNCPDEILNKYNSAQNIKSSMEYVNLLDSLSARGTKVYVSGGNNGNYSLNLLSLVDNSICVSSLNNEGKKAFYSSSNSLVNRFEKDNIRIKKVNGGYVLDTGYGDVFVDRKNTTSLCHIPSLRKLRGTSFAPPKALVKDFNSSK